MIVTANRNGFLYILDRMSGKFMFARSFMSTQNWARGIDENGRPISAGLIPDQDGVRVCPANGGATNWYSPSYDPHTDTFYFRSYEACATFQSRPKPFEEGNAYYATGIRSTDDTGKAYINAFNLDTLDFSWRELQIGRNKGWGGLMSTATGLLAYGDDADNFVVLDAHTGKPL